MLTGEMDAYPQTHSQPPDAVVLVLNAPLDKHEAGALLRRRREALGLTQEQVAEQVGIPTITQLSEYENGKVSIARSKYLPGLARALRLSEADVKSINPSAVFELANETPAPKPFPAAPFAQTDELYLPDGLRDAIEKFGDDPEYAALRDPAVARQVALARGFDGGPETAGEWLAFYLSNKRWIDGKKGN